MRENVGMFAHNGIRRNNERGDKSPDASRIRVFANVIERFSCGTHRGKR